MIESTPKFVQGIFAFSGAGYERPTALASHTVASDRRAQPVYLRAGNSSDELVVLTLSRDGETMRLFPLGARSASHVPLAVVEDIMPDTRLDISVAAPAGTSGTIVLDLGLVEI
jgi:hypothetical protein